MKDFIRILICCVVAFVVLFICSTCIVLLGLEELPFLHILGAILGYLSGKYLNAYLKKKYSSNK